jgi:VIT1/CCC1 family predicted Fe2+/Mn2+ transporter
MRDLPQAPSLTREDWLGALAVFLLVFLSTFPVVIPFIVLRSAHLAIRASNLVAIVMLFLCGYLLARHGGYHP